MDGRTPPSLPSAELPAETSAVPPTEPSNEPSTGPPVAPPREWAHYLPASPALRETGLACLGAGEQSGPLPPLAERVLSRHALVLVSSGAGTFTDPAGTHPVTAPAWIWLEPGTPHSYGPDAHGWTEHWVLFEGVGARTYRSHSGIGDGHVLRRGGPEPAERAEIFAALHRAGTVPGRRAQLHASSLVHRLLGALLGDAEEDPQRTSVTRTVVATATEDLSVAQRAALSGVGVDEFRAQIRRATGLTPHEFVLTTRLSRAQELLARSDLPIWQVAAEVGIDDASYFTRLFTRRIGVAPRTFRHEQRRDRAVTSET